VVVRVPDSASATLAALRDRGIIGGLDLGRFYPELSDCILMAATELTTGAQIEALATALTEIAASALAHI
jgi:glycine dehydrogenase subunit 1